MLSGVISTFDRMFARGLWDGVVAGAGVFRPLLRLLGLVGVPGEGLDAELTPGGKKMNSRKCNTHSWHFPLNERLFNSNSGDGSTNSAHFDTYKEKHLRIRTVVSVWNIHQTNKHYVIFMHIPWFSEWQPEQSRKPASAPRVSEDAAGGRDQRHCHCRALLSHVYVSGKDFLLHSL